MVAISDLVKPVRFDLDKVVGGVDKSSGFYLRGKDSFAKASTYVAFRDETMHTINSILLLFFVPVTFPLICQIA